MSENRELHEREERQLFREVPASDPAIGYPTTSSGLLEMFGAQLALDRKVADEIMREVREREQGA